jgi:hypothetical protein
MVARGAHYTALLDTIDHRGATKLHARERQQLLEATDALLFGEPESERTVRSAEDLIEALQTRTNPAWRIQGASGPERSRATTNAWVAEVASGNRTSARSIGDISPLLALLGPWIVVPVASIGVAAGAGTADWRVIGHRIGGGEASLSL